MDMPLIIPALALVTLLSIIGFAIYNKKKVEERIKDDNAPKSTLAKDVPSKGKPADV